MNACKQTRMHGPRGQDSLRATRALFRLRRLQRRRRASTCARVVEVHAPSYPSGLSELNGGPWQRLPHMRLEELVVAASVKVPQP